MPVFTNDEGLLGQHRDPSQYAGVLASDARRILFYPDLMPRGRDPIPKGLFRLIMPVDMGDQKAVRRINKARLSDTHDETGPKQPYLRSTSMVSFDFNPKEVTVISAQDYKLLEQHPDFKSLTKRGALRELNPRVVKNANAESVPSATGTTADYEITDAMEIIQNTYDTDYLSQSIGPERELGRPQIIGAIQERLKQVKAEVEQRIQASKNRVSNPLAG